MLWNSLDVTFFALGTRSTVWNESFPFVCNYYQRCCEGDSEYEQCFGKAVKLCVWRWLQEQRCSGALPALVVLGRWRGSLGLCRAQSTNRLLVAGGAGREKQPLLSAERHLCPAECLDLPGGTPWVSCPSFPSWSSRSGQPHALVCFLWLSYHRNVLPILTHRSSPFIFSLLPTLWADLQKRVGFLSLFFFFSSSSFFF